MKTTCLFLLIATACKPPLSHSFAVTPNPVLLGPITRIGGSPEPWPGSSDPIGLWAHRHTASGGGISTRYQPARSEPDFDLFKSLGGDTAVPVRGRWDCGGSVYLILVEGQTCVFHGAASQ